MTPKQHKNISIFIGVILLATFFIVGSYEEIIFGPIDQILIDVFGEGLPTAAAEGILIISAIVTAIILLAKFFRARGETDQLRTDVLVVIKTIFVIILLLLGVAILYGVSVSIFPELEYL